MALNKQFSVAEHRGNSLSPWIPFNIKNIMGTDAVKVMVLVYCSVSSHHVSVMNILSSRVHEECNSVTHYSQWNLSKFLKDFFFIHHNFALNVHSNVLVFYFSNAGSWYITVLLSKVSHISELLFQELEWWLKPKGKLARHVNSNHGDRTERKVNYKYRVYHFCQCSINSQYAQEKKELSYGWESQTTPILRHSYTQLQGGVGRAQIHTSPVVENRNLFCFNSTKGVHKGKWRISKWETFNKK